MLTKLLGAAAIAVGVSILVPTLAFGHADYDHSTPNDGETVTAAPSRVDAYFSQDMKNEAGANSLNVKNASGADVDNNDSAVDASDLTHMSITLQPNLPAGTYTVEWATTSDEDGEEDDGTFTFTIAAAGAATSTPAPGAPVTGFGPGSEDGSGGLMTLLLAVAAAGALAISGSAVLRVRRSR
jgi:methionine-rich copper-binding protein CopC